ncbi:hypothetical protein [uncultured Tateyamaria sp.]|uniref:hypothetical protein n=1 Tax=uncultured Tateyamaria sp. TaxID=455651 RepID=UPI00262BF0BE|nr:hypothetical protein [uncultured Tateyamaria sp.]
MSALSRTADLEPDQRKPVGWCRTAHLVALLGRQAHSTEILFGAAAETPARRDGLVLDRRLRLDSGLVCDLNARAFVPQI